MALPNALDRRFLGRGVAQLVAIEGKTVFSVIQEPSPSGDAHVVVGCVDRVTPDAVLRCQIALDLVLDAGADQPEFPSTVPDRWVVGERPRVALHLRQLSIARGDRWPLQFDDESVAMLIGHDHYPLEEKIDPASFPIGQENLRALTD